MPGSYATPTLVVNIKREFFAAILSQPRRKPIEYRDMTPYWLRRLEKVGLAPFNLRLLNGMQPPVPEATVRVVEVRRNSRKSKLEFHLGRVLEVRNWNRREEQPE